MSSLPQEIRERLGALAKGRGDVSETARWAADTMEAGDPVWRTEAVWAALEQLAAADGDTPAAEFGAWLREFEQAQSDEAVAQALPEDAGA
jgi:hypothetical protein